jgi:hypothetical protein
MTNQLGVRELWRAPRSPFAERDDEDHQDHSQMPERRPLVSLQLASLRVTAGSAEARPIR